MAESSVMAKLPDLSGATIFAHGRCSPNWRRCVLRAYNPVPATNARDHAMATAENARGMIAVDKMGGKVLFLDPATYATEVVIDGFPRTVHELLIVPESGRAYVPIFGDGIHGRNPNPQHHLCVFDLAKRAHVGTIDLRPYIAPHTLKLGPDGLIYITCENSAVVAVIDRATNKVVDAIDSGSSNGHRLIISSDGKRLYTENEED